jgi:putative aldouronate transport system substrate-binding protein
MNQRYMMLATAMTLLGSTILSACTSTDGKDGTATTTKTAVAVAEAGVFPIVEKPITMKVMVKGNALVEDFNTNEFTKWYEAKTNIHIDWEIVPPNNAPEKLNVVLASGDYPDVILDMGVSPTQQMIYGEQGSFLALNDLIDKYGVEIKKMFGEQPDTKDLITAPNGKIYSLPQVNQCYHCSMSSKMWIYKPWLDKLGLKMPVTTDEFYQVLKAFREKDPNGNGKQDEIPFAGAFIGPGTQIDLFMMSAFVYNPQSHLYLKNGKVETSFDKPEWKEGLKYMNKLFAEKLISAESFTQDTTQFKQMGENADTPILGVAVGQAYGQFSQVYGKSGRWKDYIAVPPLKGPGGLQITDLNPYGIKQGTFVITDKAKNPAAALRWADGLFNREITLTSVFGRKDKEWEYAKPDEKGINGKPAIWKRLVNFGQVQNIHWAQTGPSLRSNDLRLGEAINPEQPLELMLYKETNEKYDPYKAKLEQILPELFFTSSQAADVADLQKTIGDYQAQMFARFVTGDLNVDTGWDNYIKTLDNMNLKKYVKIYQDAYDAKFKSKK